jgi:rhodanese-related sulfurtransferase
MKGQIYQDVEAREMSDVFAQARDQYVWVDVRTDEEYQAGHIPNTLHIPHDQMESRYMELISYQQRKILLVCRSGGRSVIAAHVLSQQGFIKLYNLKGGMLEWTGPVHTQRA